MSHSCRAVWNLAVEQRQYLHRHRDVTLRAGAQSVDRAYDNWWNPRHPAGPPPTFKRRNDRLAIPFPGQAVKVHRLNRKWERVWLPKVGSVRFRLSRPLGGIVRNATVSRDGCGT